MAVLEGEKLVEDRWIGVADGDPVPVDQPAIVTSARMLAEPEALAPRTAPLGVALRPDADADELRPVLDRLELVLIEFPAFRDGRGFTQARALREHLRFAGDIRATGHVIPDQYAYLLRCGFTSVVLPPHHGDPALWLRARDAITIVYQPGLTPEDPISEFRRRLV